jgi:hypothetical protein
MRNRLQSEDDIEILEQYDQEEDIYYVSMQTPEPSLAEEVDDMLIVEFGILTGMPTGFRILNYAKNKLKADAFKSSFKKACIAAGLQKSNSSENRRQQIERRIDRFFDAVGA